MVLFIATYIQFYRDDLNLQNILYITQVLNEKREQFQT